MAYAKIMLFSFIRAFPLGEIASFESCLGAKLFFRLRLKSYVKGFATGSLGFGSR
jgi:hypothetical protein